MMQELLARVVYDDNYQIGCSTNKVTGYIIEIQNIKTSEWSRATFVQVNDDNLIHESFLIMLSSLYNMGYKILWDI